MVLCFCSISDGTIALSKRIEFSGNAEAIDTRIEFISFVGYFGILNEGFRLVEKSINHL